MAAVLVLYPYSSQAIPVTLARLVKNNLQLHATSWTSRLDDRVPAAINNLPLSASFDPLSQTFFVENMLTVRYHNFAIQLEVITADITIPDEVHVGL